MHDLFDTPWYIIKRKIAPYIPDYEVQMKGTNKKTRTLHRNMLLPFYGIPDPEEIEIPLSKQQPAMLIPSSDSSEEPLSAVTPVMRRGIIDKKGLNLLPNTLSLHVVIAGKISLIQWTYLTPGQGSHCAGASRNEEHQIDSKLLTGVQENMLFM